MTPEQFREANSYADSEGNRIPALRITAWDVIVMVLRSLARLFTDLAWLTQAHANAGIERQAVQLEAQAEIERITSGRDLSGDAQ